MLAIMFIILLAAAAAFILIPWGIDLVKEERKLRKPIALVNDFRTN